MTEAREFQDGEVIAGTRYRVLKLIGVGGMGSVYQVEHVELGKHFVLKALLRQLSGRGDLVQRLRNEWRALARLQHENIVNVTDAGTSGGGVPFYVMERLEGDTLAEVLRRKRRLHVLEAVHIAACVLEALSAAHDIGVIHRDVKPANVFIVNGGGVKLLDFGIAKIADANSVVTARGLAVGTPRYMSPEQARGESVDGRSDVYASALILFEMIAGVGPFDDVRDSNELLLAHLAREVPPLSSLVSGVSPELELILARMLAKDCRRRPAHAREAAELLRGFALRQASAVSTDAPTARANYSAQTVAAAPRRESVPSPIHDSITRPEGARRRQLPPDESHTDDALTQRIAHSPETTQVTLSARTGESFSVSSVPSTTFVSPPSFDGSTTLPMSTVSRHAHGFPPASDPPLEGRVRTERLGEFPLPPPPAAFEPPDTRTHVPLPERTRPASITPPPVVDTGRVESLGPPRAQRVGRWASLAAAGFGLLVVTGFVLRRAAPAGDTPDAPVAASQPVARKIPVSSVPEQPKGAETSPESLGATAPAASVGPSPAPTAPVAAPASSGSAGNSRTIIEAKRHRIAPLTTTPVLSQGSPTGPFVRSSAARSSAPPMPGSGL